ncbi:Short-chain alcohol dehydrogenase of unknown specificity [Variovorax sp. HW608]|uniref:SDR family NAD(P)-dependent oxidoreductase n=1 Tax=Variovorax sp. HW608 TaxID=1034889 RepID=UPI00081F7F90|nr:SDR family NAD(P)-dependent oxidoreductase [Variovorax sp. HW608]SCK29891.1 Short-chain alcohol dehydrogenase of unknown specificity [Variovorax sp. HW608]
MTATTASSKRHALVTGAPGGIGRGICFALIEQAQRDGTGIHVTAAASRPGERLDRLVDELQSAGATAAGVAGDLTDPADGRAGRRSLRPQDGR